MTVKLDPQMQTKAASSEVGRSLSQIDGTTLPILSKDQRIGMVSQLPEDLWQELIDACSEIRALRPREALSRAGEPITQSALLLEGMMVRYVDGSAEKRLMVAVQVPGDFVDLHGLPLGRLDHDVIAMRPSTVALFPHDELNAIMENNAKHARLLWRLTMIDASMHRHWTFRIGRLRAMASVANFLCEMDIRMTLCGLAEGRSFQLGLTQVDLGEVSGLSSVHVSRVLKELRDARLCCVRDGVVEIYDRAGLRQLAGFDPRYLYLPGDIQTD